MSMIKYRVHEVAKDFNVPTKAITQILTDYAATPKNHMQVLENHELEDWIYDFEFMREALGRVPRKLRREQEYEQQSFVF